MTGPVTLSPFLALVPASATCADEVDPDESHGRRRDGGGHGHRGRRLAALPASGATESEIVLWGDLARVAEIGGIERPAPDDGDAVAEYVTALKGQRLGPDEEAPVAAMPPDATHPAYAKPR